MEKILLRLLGMGARLGQGDEGAFRLRERRCVLGPLALHAHGRAFSLAGRVHLCRHELAPLYGYALRRPHAARLREHVDRGEAGRRAGRSQGAGPLLGSGRLPPGHGLEHLRRPESR